MATRKISVTVDEELVDAMQGRIGARGVSAFVSRAVRHELEREELGELLADLEKILGPPDKEMLDEAAAAFDHLDRARKPRPRRRSA